MKRILIACLLSLCSTSFADTTPQLFNFEISDGKTEKIQISLPLDSPTPFEIEVIDDNQTKHPKCEVKHEFGTMAIVEPVYSDVISKVNGSLFVYDYKNEEVKVMFSYNEKTINSKNTLKLNDLCTFTEGSYSQVGVVKSLTFKDGETQSILLGNKNIAIKFNLLHKS
jgi:hypothetical protein